MILSPPKKGLLVLLCSLLYASLWAQYNLTKIYTVADGLPITEVARCLVSREGRVFLITTTGHRVSFDGFTFTDFTKNKNIQKFNSPRRF